MLACLLSWLLVALPVTGERPSKHPHSIDVESDASAVVPVSLDPLQHWQQLRSALELHVHQTVPQLLGSLLQQHGSQAAWSSQVGETCEAISEDGEFTECAPSKAIVDALPKDSKVREWALESRRCGGLAEGACLQAGCGWSQGACSMKEPEDDPMAALGTAEEIAEAFGLNSQKCGVLGTLISRHMICSSKQSGTCANNKCRMQTEQKLVDGQCTMKSSCAPMQLQGETDEMKRVGEGCHRQRGSNACAKAQHCVWTGLDCSLNVASYVPSTCAFQPLLEWHGYCDNIGMKTSCEGDPRCKWEREEKCSPTGLKYGGDKCTAQDTTPTSMLPMMRSFLEHFDKQKANPQLQAA